MAMVSVVLVHRACSEGGRLGKGRVSMRPGWVGENIAAVQGYYGSSLGGEGM